jgi:hypothetical protein
MTDLLEAAEALIETGYPAPAQPLRVVVSLGEFEALCAAALAARAYVAEAEAAMDRRTG